MTHPASSHDAGRKGIRHIPPSVHPAHPGPTREARCKDQVVALVAVSKYLGAGACTQMVLAAWPAIGKVALTTH